MSLDALAPDQRAVVQLVLQQDRSYEDLAALLGITPDAVRERAQRGLERLAPAEAVIPSDRAEISDYLLGQQGVSQRESTRALLHRDEAARVWALAIASELAGVARSPLPDVPTGAIAATPTPDPVVSDPEPVLSTFPEPVTDEPTPTRARPRPRREAEPGPAAITPTATPDFGFGDDEAAATPIEAEGTSRSSRLGGALLILGVAIFVAVIIVWLMNRGDKGDTGSTKTPTTSASTQPTASPTATGTPDFQPIGQLALKSATGGTASGQLVVYAASSGQVAFNIVATKVPATAEGQAYGVWLVGGGSPHFLGFAPPVGKNGKFAVSGPRTSDQTKFASWLGKAKQVVVSTETKEGASAPGPLILEGNISDAKTAGGATPTPSPTP